MSDIDRKDINSKNAIEPLTESPAVEKTVSDSDGLGASTFLGKPRRGGWRPIQLDYPGHKPGHGMLEIIDWQCPQCNLPIYKSVSGKHKCMKCGLPVLEYPIVKLTKIDFDDRDMRRSWKTWMDNKLNPDEE
jgi:hypothetical protein